MILNNIIYPSELLEWIDAQKDFQIIDLTADNLLKDLKIPALWIPVHSLINRLGELTIIKPLILCCRVGADSFISLKILANHYQMDNVFSLKSGALGLEELLKERGRI